MNKRFELGSKAWCDEVCSIVRELLAGAELEGSYAFSEEYLDAPAHLPRDENGRVGWHFRVALGVLTTASGPLDGADMAITVDYALVQPLASIPYTDTARMSEARRAMRDGARAGRFHVRGKVAPNERFSELAALHDRVAAITT